MADGGILVINSGSSSVKRARSGEAQEAPRRLASGAVERIGFDGARLALRNARGESLEDERRDIRNHVATLHLLLSELERLAPDRPPKTAATHQPSLACARQPEHACCPLVE